MTKEKWPQLPVKFKEKWVAALRSGKYKQDKDQGLLETDDGKFCCLGVACKVAGIGNNEKNDYLLSQSWVEDTKNFKIKGVPKVLKEDGELPTRLAEMNDEGKSFKFIATWIEENL